MNTHHNIQISRHYKNRMDERKKLAEQIDLKFPATEETKKKLLTHIKEIGMMSYDRFNDFYWGVYKGIKVVCDVMEKNCHFYCVSGESESYHEADEFELLHSLNK